MCMPFVFCVKDSNVFSYTDGVFANLQLFLTSHEAASV
jgi:hypothetical protein